MTDSLFLLGSIAGVWAEAMWRASWQGGLALGLAWAICRLTPRLPPTWHCWLWRAAYLKVVVTLLWATPIDLPLLPARPQLETAGVRLTDRSRNGFLVRSTPSSTIGLPVPSPAATATPASSGEPQRTAPVPGMNWESGLLLVWLLGTGVHFGRLIRQRRRIAQLRRGCGACADPQSHRLLAELCRRLGLRLLPDLLVADVPGPLVVGALNPAVVLPVDLQATEAEREWILAHELAHVKRRDLWWGYLPALTRVLFFFHPVVWLAHREWRLAQEMACDALTLRITSARACDYGELLVRLASRRPETSEIGLSAVGILESGTSLERRLYVLRSISSPTRTGTLCGSVLVALAFGGTVPWRVSAQASANRTPTPAGRAQPAATPAVAPLPATRSTPPVRASQPAAPATVTPHRSFVALAPQKPVQAKLKPAQARTAPSKKPHPSAKTTARPRVTPPSAAPAQPTSPAVSDPELLQAAGISVGPYGGLIAVLTPTELLQYVATEHRATMSLLSSTKARVQNGVAPSAELVPLETKAQQLEILMRAAERLAQAPPTPRRTELYASLTPQELLQFLRTELQGVRSLRELKQAQYDVGTVSGSELLPLESRTQQLEILVRAAERRAQAPR